MAPKYDIWLVRHGETEWSATGQHTGRTDVPLTAEGKRQAEALRPVVQEHDFALELSSPLSRAVETCRLSGATDDPETTDALLEWDYGEGEGRKTADIRRELGKPDWTIWTDGTPGGVDLAAAHRDLAERARRLWD